MATDQLRQGASSIGCACSVRSLCRPISRDIFVQDIPEDVQTVADIPDGWMPSRLPFGRDVVTPAQIGGA
jgi:hypothetical protein